MRFTSVGGSGGGCGCCGGGGTTPCLPCAIPNTNLTLAWVNILVGNGSTTLTFSASPRFWTSACAGGANGIWFTAELQCLGSSPGTITLSFTFYGNSSCTNSLGTSCSSADASPNSLHLSSTTCSPFSMTWTTDGSNNCPTLFSAGYTSFTVHS